MSKFYKLCLLLSVPPFQNIKFWCSLFRKFMALVYHNLKIYVEKQDSVRIVAVKTLISFSQCKFLGNLAENTS